MSSSVSLASLSKPDFLAHWFKRVWTEEDPSAIDEMMAMQAPIKGVGNADSVGPPDFKVFHKSILQHITGMKFTILRTAETGDWLAALWSFTAEHRISKKEVSSTGTVFIEIRDGKILGGYNHFDTIGMYQDIGLMPPDTVPRLLSGDALT